jgi:hypothetical protein
MKARELAASRKDGCCKNPHYTLMTRRERMFTTANYYFSRFTAIPVTSKCAPRIRLATPRNARAGNCSWK